MNEQDRRVALIQAAATWGASGVNDPRFIVIYARLWERWVNGELDVRDLTSDAAMLRLLGYTDAEIERGGG